MQNGLTDRNALTTSAMAETQPPLTSLNPGGAVDMLGQWLGGDAASGQPEGAQRPLKDVEPLADTDRGMNLGMTLEQALDEAARIAGVTGRRVLGGVSVFGDWKTSDSSVAIECRISIFNGESPVKTEVSVTAKTWPEVMNKLRESLNR